VSTHNAPNDCWCVFENKVYDLTDYLNQHDVYLDIREWCGNDMAEDFKDKAGVGRDHKTSSYYLLENYYIGELDSTASTEEKTSTEPAAVTDQQDTDNHKELYSVEISGQELKTLTIDEIADLWVIDSDELLRRTIIEFDLQSNYSIKDTLEELRSEYKFSPSQIKDIAEEIKTGKETPITEDTIESRIQPKNPYNFALPFFTSLFTYGLSWYLSKSSLGKKSKLLAPVTFNLFWNTVLFISLFPSAIFGFYMIIRFSVPELYNVNFNFLYWHVEGPIVFGTISIPHFITRLKLYLVPLNLFRRNQGTEKVEK